MLPSPSQLRPQDELFVPHARPELRLVPRQSEVAVLLNANAKKVNERVKRSLGALVPERDLFYCHTIEEAQAHARPRLHEDRSLRSRAVISTAQARARCSRPSTTAARSWGLSRRRAAATRP